MLGIVIATHGKFSSGLKDSANVIMGATTNIATVSLNQGDEISDFGNKIKAAIQEVDKGNGVVVLVDLVSASPYNQSLLIISELEQVNKDSIHVISGVNLAMLLEAINHQLLETPIKTAVELITEQGISSITKWNLADLTVFEDDEDDF